MPHPTEMPATGCTREEPERMSIKAMKDSMWNAHADDDASV